MKIVQINTVCGTGSTGRLCTDLYHISESINIIAEIAYGRGSSPAGINSYKISNFFDFGAHVLTNFINGNSGFGSQYVTKKFILWLEQIKPDIIHLHNIHGFYIHLGLLFDYIKEKKIPVIWTLHDCWSFTGQCAHFDYVNCNKWQSQCHHCPIYKSNYPYSIFKDNSKINYLLKKVAFTNVENLTIVTPSSWLASLVEKSFLKDYPIKIIPNGIDTQIFKPDLTLKLKSPKKILLGVANVWTIQKGLRYFYELADNLDATYQIVLIGVSQKQKHFINKHYRNRITAIPRTQNVYELVTWYQRAFAFINPTLEDTFPTTNLEALACGTPVITFNTGGSPECLNDSCGIIVEKGNSSALKKAVMSLVSNRSAIYESCIERGSHYNKNLRLAEYLKLYRMYI